MTFGTLGVDGFFILSGYLIVQSWLGDPELINFLRKRVLRIVPGYLVAVFLSTLAVGLLAPGVDQFLSWAWHTFLQQRRSSQLANDPSGVPRSSVCDGERRDVHHRIRVPMLPAGGAAGAVRFTPAADAGADGYRPSAVYASLRAAL